MRGEGRFVEGVTSNRMLVTVSFVILHELNEASLVMVA